jgi:hypothetical protein
MEKKVRLFRAILVPEKKEEQEEKINTEKNFFSVQFCLEGGWLNKRLSLAVA